MHIQAFQPYSGSRSCIGHAPTANRQSRSVARDKWSSNLRPFPTEEILGPNNARYQIFGNSAATQKIQGYGGVRLACRVPPAPRTRLTQVSVRFGPALLVSPQLSILLAAIRADRMWPVFSGCFAHTLISRIPSSRRLRSTPEQCSCCVHSQHSWEMNGSVCIQCLGADVGWIVIADHLHQSEAPFFDCFLTPGCF